MKSIQANVSKIIQKYIDMYNQETKKDEVKYKISNEDAASLGPDFIRVDKSRAYFCFYDMPAEKYDKEVQYTAQAAFYPELGHDKDNKIKLALNVVMPARDGMVDKPLINELISHELTHAQRFYSELNQGHFSFTNVYLKPLFRKNKYTMLDRNRAYEKTTPYNSGTDIDKFRWVGYVLNNDEMYANLAGIDGFIYEHHGKKYNLKDSRFIQLTDIVCKYLDWIEKEADENLWIRVMKEVTYIPPLKNESVSRFKRRWIAYYKNQLRKFDLKLQKIIDKYEMQKSEKFTIGHDKIINKSQKRINLEMYEKNIKNRDFLLYKKTK